MKLSLEDAWIAAQTISHPSCGGRCRFEVAIQVEHAYPHHMQPASIIVRADWDSEAGVFVATSDDVPGLVAEAATIPELTAKLEVLIPELLALNAHELDDDGPQGEIPLVVMSQQVTKLRLHS